MIKDAVVEIPDEGEVTIGVLVLREGSGFSVFCGFGFRRFSLSHHGGEQGR